MVERVRALSIGLIAIAVLVMAWHFSQYLGYSLAAIRYRFEIFDAEGIVWQQAMLIPGPRMYGDINTYPFIVFHYPPLYHLASRALSWLGCTPLLAGRALSLASALVIGATIAALTHRLTGQENGPLAAALGAAVAGLAFFCFYPVILTSTVMRVDMLAIALSYLGLLAFTASDSRAPYVGMVLFVAAVFTKQTALAAPLSALAVTGFLAPRRALKLIGFGVALGAVPLAILMAMTHGAFLRHLVLYNINRYYPFLIWSELSGQAAHLVFVLIGLAVPVLWWRRFWARAAITTLAGAREALRRDRAAPLMAMLTIYLALTTLMLAGLGKNGAGISYFDEWVGLLSILIGVFVARIAAPAEAASGFAVSPLVRILAPALLIVQVAILPAKGALNFGDAAEARASDSLVDMIAAAPGPVLSSDMVMLMIAGKGVPWEPAIFAELASLGRWDESQITQMIAARRFSFVVTRPATHFTPAVAAAVAAAYPRTQEIGRHIVHLPPD